MEFGTSSSSDQAFILNLPIFEAFHQLPHGDFRTSFYNPYEVKHRKRTTRSQFEVLEKAFHENPKPNNALRRTLAQELAMTPRGVQVWFQNRRAKAKNSKNYAKFDHNNSAVPKNGPIGDDNLCSNPEERSQVFESSENPTPKSLVSKISSSILKTVTGEDLNKKNSISKKLVESSVKKSRSKPQSIKIATAAEQYQKIMQHHQSQRDCLETLPQQRKRSLESQFYYHQNAYSYGISSPEDRYIEFRSRANSLPGTKTRREAFGSTSITESSYATEHSSYMSNTLPAPASAMALPNHLHDYMSTYSTSINSITDDPDTQNNLVSSMNPATSGLPGSIRRNSCPPEFIASFVSMGFVPTETQHLATIAEDDQFYENIHLVNHSQGQPFFQGQQPLVEVPYLMLNDSLAIPFAKPSYSQHIAQSTSYGNHSSQIGDHGKIKMRRLSEPHISIVLDHQDIHHNDLLQLNTNAARQNSIQQYSSIGPSALMRCHSMDSTNWGLVAKASSMSKPHQSSNQMNFSTFQMNSDHTRIPLDGPLSSTNISTSLPYMEDINYSIYISDESLS